MIRTGENRYAERTWWDMQGLEKGNEKCFCYFANNIFIWKMNNGNSRGNVTRKYNVAYICRAKESNALIKNRLQHFSFYTCVKFFFVSQQPL